MHRLEEELPNLGGSGSYATFMVRLLDLDEGQEDKIIEEIGDELACVRAIVRDMLERHPKLRDQLPQTVAGIAFIQGATWAVAARNVLGRDRDA
jgi:hypothetical protein